jgi:1-phosphofructokinase
MIITVTLNPAVDKVLTSEDFSVGAHCRVQVQSITAAGKGINVARGIARLGGVAGACALVGRDEHRMFHESLHRDTIESRFVLLEDRTRVNTTILDPKNRTTTHLREPGFQVTPEDLAELCHKLADWLPELPEETPVVFAGSLPPGVATGDFAAVIEAVAQSAPRIVVDTNGLALRAALETGALHTVKPNLQELSQCLDRDLSPGQCLPAARRLLDRVDTVLVTMGASGAWLLHEEAEHGWKCPLETSELQNTVGCGDAFMAGWLHARAKGAGRADSLRWAVAAGAASARSETSVGYTLADVEELLPRCESLDDSQ